MVSSKIDMTDSVDYLSEDDEKKKSKKVSSNNSAL
jgi:hypothetical protein